MVGFEVQAASIDMGHYGLKDNTTCTITIAQDNHKEIILKPAASAII